jgi:uncharacterized phage protein (TIGR02218 family)
MTFAIYEESIEGGQPVELYVYHYQGGTFYHTTADADYDLAGVIYTAVPGLSRSEIDDTGEISKSSLTLTAPENYIISALFEVYPPSDVVELTVYRLQRADPTDPKIMWLGRVLNCTWSVGYSTLMCESMQTRLKQPGLRRIYSKNCPHVLYGSECRANQVFFEETATLDAITAAGFDLHSPDIAGFPDGYFSGGKMAFDAGGGIIDRRSIRTHLGDRITLSHPIPALDSSSTITLWPGCDRTKETCITKFNNLENYGGFPYMREKNPFGQSSVF